jgi:2-polyprenyl-3-methyl-5-hydroxy-6-metoxy-1,4-benzoquinol methylase
MSQRSKAAFLGKLMFRETVQTIKRPSRIFELLDEQKRLDIYCALNLNFKYLSPWSRLSPKQIVEDGYDRVSDQYTGWTSRAHKEQRDRCVGALLNSSPEGLKLLDLGCGTGLPSTKMLARHFEVTGVDISRENIKRARLNVLNARFIRSDMIELALSPESFDLVTAFYSVFHLPRSEQPVLLGKIFSWLREGGLVVATMAATSIDSHIEKDWLGAPMYWSSFDGETNKRLFEGAGFEVLGGLNQKEYAFGKSNTFLWIVAQKPEMAPTRAAKRNADFMRLFNDNRPGGLE